MMATMKKKIFSEIFKSILKKTKLARNICKCPIIFIIAVFSGPSVVQTFLKVICSLQIKVILKISKIFSVLLMLDSGVPSAKTFSRLQCQILKISQDKNWWWWWPWSIMQMCCWTWPRDPKLTYAVIAIDNIEYLVAGLLVGHVVGTDAAEDRRLSEGLPGSVTGLSAITKTNWEIELEI